MILARPIHVPSDPRRYLLKRDVAIPMEAVPKLAELGIFEVWIRYRELEFLEDIFDEGLENQQRELYGHVRRSFEAVMRGTVSGLDVQHFETSIGSLFDFLKGSSAGNLMLKKLDAYDNYLMSHSANVCYLALLLGMRLERYLIEERQFKNARDAKDLRLLGMGCLLHDVGKMKIPLEVLNKPGKLTAEERDIMMRHPQLGYDMINGRIPVAAAQVVLNHHQRWDGKGYPSRTDRRTGEMLPPLQGKQIPIFCRIATIVDIYDAATTQRCYSAAKPPVQVLHELRNHCRGMVDPVVAEAFFQVIPAFPIGQVVRLSNGVEAVVVDFNPAQPYRPKVQGLRDPYGETFSDPSLEEIDLALNRDLSIEMIDEYDVRPYIPADDALASGETGAYAVAGS